MSLTTLDPKTALVVIDLQKGIAVLPAVESTAREAHSLGFNVTLAVDAMTDLSAEAHASSLQRIFPRLGESGNTQDIIDLLDSLDRGQA